MKIQIFTSEFDTIDQKAVFGFKNSGLPRFLLQSLVVRIYVCFHELV